ncbi:MAG: GIY-YIG nuclease family protein [Acidobacteria bacterium]|nr:GIY-YIG nuclease family protein [Acidobacteriota bacterium]
MFYTYIITNKRNGTLYTGHTDDLARRMWEHRGGHLPGFARKYGCNRLVWCEAHDTRDSAFMRERQIKEWKRNWKLVLIERENPHWQDLFDAMMEWVPEETELTRWQRSQPGSRLSPG